ncbi:MAG: SseB family protein [Roseburia sp.]|nr:SseB family protein [Roseburia sp.]
MDEKVTMEITNDRLEEAIREYAAERTKEKLSAVLNLLRPTKLFVPAMLKAPDQPTPCFLKNNNGEQFFVAYTSKAQIPPEPKSQALLAMPFPACNNIVVKPELKLNGMVINPFSDNLVLKIELIEKLHEADQKAPQMKQIKMTPQQFDVFVKKQVEFGVMPKRLFTEGETFVEKLCDEREAFVNEIFAATYKEAKLNPYTESDYSVMALDIAEDLTLIRVDLPEKGMIPTLCYRVYITFNPQTKKAGYYTIEMTKEKDVHMLGQILPGGKREEIGEAPVEGAELQKIMDLARYEEGELTS